MGLVRVHFSKSRDMAKKIITKIGDVFCVEFDNDTKGYFQYIANDMTELNSSVIRAFKNHYPIGQSVEIEEIVNDEVDFYAHTVLRNGIADGSWYKVGKSINIGLDSLNNVIFGHPQSTEYINGNIIDVSYETNWYIWNVNKKHIKIGTISPPLLKKVTDGAIVRSIDIITKMKRGYYLFNSYVYDLRNRIPRPEYISYVKFNDNNTDVYKCFKGDYFDRAVIINNGKVTRITREEAVINHMEIAHRKFSDTNWKNRDFITEEEFNQIWNSK